MISAFLIALAVLIAISTIWGRAWRHRRTEQRRPGATMQAPITIERFDQIDPYLAPHACRCGGVLTVTGETSRAVDAQQFRAIRHACTRCTQERYTYFDVTHIFH